MDGNFFVRQFVVQRIEYFRYSFKERLVLVRKPEMIRRYFLRNSLARMVQADVRRRFIINLRGVLLWPAEKDMEIVGFGFHEIEDHIQRLVGLLNLFYFGR